MARPVWRRSPKRVLGGGPPRRDSTDNGVAYYTCSPNRRHGLIITAESDDIMPSRFSIGEAESYELPPLGGEIDDGDEDTRDEAAKLLRRSTDGKRFSEEDQEGHSRSGKAVELDEDEIVGKGSSVEALIERVGLVSWHQQADWNHMDQRSS